MVAMLSGFFLGSLEETSTDSCASTYIGMVIIFAFFHVIGPLITIFLFSSFVAPPCFPVAAVKCTRAFDNDVLGSRTCDLYLTEFVEVALEQKITTVKGKVGFWEAMKEAELPRAGGAILVVPEGWSKMKCEV